MCAGGRSGAETDRALIGRAVTAVVLVLIELILILCHPRGIELAPRRRGRRPIWDCLRARGIPIQLQVQFQGRLAAVQMLIPNLLSCFYYIFYFCIYCKHQHALRR